jgi:hypothetical protein
MNLLLAALMLALVWFGNGRLRRRVDIDPADPHALRVGPVRYRLDWAIGTMTDHALRKENSTTFVDNTASPRAAGDERSYAPSGETVFMSGVRLDESFALVEGSQRTEFAFTNFTLDDWVGQRLIFVWITVNGERYYLRFYNWTTKQARQPPFRYWKLIEREASEAVWTAVPAIVFGWIVAGWLGLWGFLGGLAAFVVWYFGAGRLLAKESDFDRDYLDPLVAKLGGGNG